MSKAVEFSIVDEEILLMKKQRFTESRMQNELLKGSSEKSGKALIVQGTDALGSEQVCQYRSSLYNM